MNRTLFLCFGLLAACSQDYSLNGEPGTPEEPVTPEAPVEETPDVEVEEPPAEEPELPEEPEEEPPVVEDPPADDCDHTEDQIYVIDRDDNALYLFDPVTLDFDLLGRLNCGSWTGTPGSMAVSRDGYAYVRYSTDEVYAVDLATMQCQQTRYSPNAFGSFGMGYATDNASTWQDALYIANDNKLAVVDTQTWQRTPLGNMPSQSELTGNAAGELWAFLPLESPALLVQVDKTTGAPLQSHRLNRFPSPYNIDAFAFATWGGDFYLFVREFGMGSTTDVYRVDAQGNMTLVAPDTGMDIVGAGVSTCASF